MNLHWLKLTLLTVILFCIDPVFSQSAESQNIWKSASKFYNRKDFEKSIAELSKIIRLEAQNENRKSFEYLQKSYELTATCYEQMGRKDSALKFLYKSIENSRKLQDTVKTGEMIMRFNTLYHLCRSETGDINLQRLMSYPKTKMQYVMFKTVNLETLRYDWRKGDTCHFKCNGGLNDGVNYGAICGFYSIHNPRYRKRPFQYLGEGKITSSQGQTAWGYFVFNQDFFDTIYVTDGAYVNTSIPVGESEDDIFNCAIAGFSSASKDYNQYYIYPTSSLYFSDPFFKTAVYNQMLKEIKDRAKAEDQYYGYMSGLKITDGRFKGKTLKEALLSSTIYDIQHFVNIPATYKTAYYNYRQEFMYEYVYWLAGTAYTGSNQNILWKLISATPEKDIKAAVSNYQFYYNYWSLLDSFFLSWSDTIENTEFKKSMNRKVLEFAKANGDNTRIAKWTKNLCYINFWNHEFEKAFDYARQWIQYEPGSYHAKLYGAVSARFIDDYKSLNTYVDTIINNETAIRSELDSSSAHWIMVHAMTYKGWSAIMNGEKSSGDKWTQKAFQQDSNNRITRSFYAFSQALKGNFSQASWQFDQVLNLLTEPVQFSHITRCFNELIEKGELSSWFRNEKERVSNNFKQNYLVKITIDSLKYRASDYYAVKARKAAMTQYETAYKYSLEKDPENTDNLLFILDWLGYIGVELAENAKSLKYYKDALEICYKNNYGIEKQILELENIVYVAELMEAYEDFRNYSLKLRDMQQTANLSKQKNLFVLSVGTNTSTQCKVTEKYAESDALKFALIQEEKGKLLFDNVTVRTITGNKLTFKEINSVFDSLAESVEFNDVFLFYYAGPTREKNNYLQLNLFDDYFLASELANKVSKMDCDNKIVILDGGNLPIDSLHNVLKKYDLKYTQKSNTLVGIRDWRMENDNKKQGLLTSGILEYYSNSSNNNLITSHGLIDYLYGSLKDKLALTSVLHGRGTTLGKKPLSGKSADTSYPVIKILNSNVKMLTRGENILTRIVDREADITGEITDPAGILMAFINGEEISIQSNGKFRYPKKLLKSDTFKIKAINKNLFKDSVAGIIENLHNPVNIISRKYAYFFATEKYFSPGWSHLPNTKFDAEAIGEILEKNYGFKIKIIANPSSIEFENELREIKRIKYSEGDQLLIYIAGHGYQHPEDGFKLVCKDAEKADSANSYKNYIPGSHLLNMIKTVDCLNKFLIMDVCYAGDMMKSTEYENYRPVTAEFELRDPDKFIIRQRGIPVFQFYFSGRSNPVLEGPPGAHSPFANQIIDNLIKGTQSQYVRTSQLRENEASYGTKSEWMPIAGYISRNDNGEFILKVESKSLDLPKQPIAMPTKPVNN